MKVVTTIVFEKPDIGKFGRSTTSSFWGANNKVKKFVLMPGLRILKTTINAQ
jgi:hypothetical protein